MSVEITMPQLSDTMTEGTVVKWHKKEGEKVKVGEKIADIETDKAVMEMEAFESGTLALIIVGDGQKVAVGAPLGLIAQGNEKVEDVKKQYRPSAAATAPAGKPQAAPAAAPSAPGQIVRHPRMNRNLRRRQAVLPNPRRFISLI